MPGPRHKCPKDGCEIELPTSKLACPDHWADVPAPLRRRVLSTWRRFMDDPGAYMEARRAAVDAMNRRTSTPVDRTVDGAP